MRRMSISAMFVLAFLGLQPSGILAGPRSSRSDDVKRLRRATDVFKEVMGTPDKGIPEELLDKSECVAIIPGITKGGIVIGGAYGKGVVMCRRSDKIWSAPSFVALEGGSVGF